MFQNISSKATFESEINNPRYLTESYLQSADDHHI